MSITEHREPIGIKFDYFVERSVERFNGLIWQTVDEIEIHRGEARFAHPVEDLLRHLAWLNSMHRFLHLRIEILHTERSPIKPHFAQCDDVVSVQPARIYLHTGFEVIGKTKMLMNVFPELPDLVGCQEGRRATAPVKLHRFALRIDERAHL